MSERDEIGPIDIDDLPDEYRDLALILVAVIGAWTLVKNTHDFDSPDFICCENTKMLFESLNSLTVETLGIYKRILAKPPERKH